MASSLSKLPAIAAIRQLLSAAQAVDRQWQEKGHAERWEHLKRSFADCRLHPSPEVNQLAKLERHFDPGCTHKHFLGILIPLERQYAKGVYDHDVIPHEGDGLQSSHRHKLSTIVVLDNIRSAFNVGAIFRSAECFGIEKLILCGYTATPENPKILKTTMGTEEHVPWEYHAHSSQVVLDLKELGYTVTALERSPSSQSLYEWQWPSKVALILGNERHGLSAHVIEHCHETIHIPVWGHKNSLNVGAAFACVASEIRRQSLNI